MKREVIIALLIGILLTILEMNYFFGIKGLNKTFSYVDYDTTKVIDFVYSGYEENILRYTSDSSEQYLYIELDEVTDTINRIVLPDNQEITIKKSGMIIIDGVPVDIDMLKDPSTNKYGVLIRNIMNRNAGAARLVRSILYLFLNIIGANILFINSDEIKKKFRKIFNVSEIKLPLWLLYKVAGIAILIAVFINSLMS